MFASPADGSIGSSPSSSLDPLSGRLSDFDLAEEALSDDEITVSPSSDSSSKNRYLYPQSDTVEELRPEEIRWFYKDETAKKPKWRAFLGYDSLRIECKYRELQQTNEKATDNKADIKAEQTEKIIVRGGLYHVSVEEKLCIPVYWNGKGDTIKVMRGTWFIDGTWQPLEDQYADEIERKHMSQFQGQKNVSEEPENAKGPAAVLLNIKFKEFHVDWNAVDRVYFFSEAASSKLYRAVGHKLGLSKSGTKLYRGYCYEATMDDKPPDITHLVFVVHGIGQKMDTGSIIKNCADLRASVTKIKERLFPDLDSNNKRAEFLPVEWRSSLKLDGDAVESITPHKVKGLRTLLNSSAMDILYYSSPLYRSEITHGLQAELNRLYAMFCEKNPYFAPSGGKVSIIAHSLGCVITYDILTGWSPVQLYDQYVAAEVEETCQNMEGCADLISQLETARAKVHDLESDLIAQTQKQHVKSSPLKFKLENFFCLGSPLAVFLALRGVRPTGNGTQEHILSRGLCKRLYNLYHPSDPIAYRLEPLILKHYAGIYPLRVHRVDSSQKVPYDQIKPRAYTMPATGSQTGSPIHVASGTHDNAEKKNKSFSGALGSMLKGWGRRSRQPELTAEMRVVEKVLARPESPASEMGKDEETLVEVASSSDPILQQTELEYRLDYQLKEGTMENAYLATLTSHTSYWSSQDVALFILMQLFLNFTPK